jgi:NAD(P)-dependent dehydrogenase (short-subunit alcohol dehydrogenase family)
MTVLLGCDLRGRVLRAVRRIDDRYHEADGRRFTRSGDFSAANFLDLTRLCTPELRKAADAGRRPRIINMGSIQSFHAMPGFAVYSATKFAVRGLSDALRVELGPLGIGVVCIEPGSIATPIWAKAGDTLRRLSESSTPRLRDDYRLEPFAAAMAQVEARGIAPERVASVVARAATAKRPRSRYSVGMDARVSKLMAHLLPPRWLDKLTRRMVDLR